MSELLKLITRLALIALALLSLSSVSFAATTSQTKHRRHRGTRAKHARRVAVRSEYVAVASGSESVSAAETPQSYIEGGVLNGKAISLPKPVYPPAARAAHATGTVVVQITIDEEGNVIFARSVSGHPLLQEAAVQAATQAKFSPTRLSGQPVKVKGVLVYNFVAQ